VDLDGATSYQPYISDLFYNGHGPSTPSTIVKSSLTLKAQQFAYLHKTALSQSAFNTAGAIGGFATMFLAVTSMFRGVIVMTYKTLFVIDDATGKSGLAANACTLGYVACMRMFGAC
jgi:hypothetical protein